MLGAKTCLAVLGVIALQTVCARRSIRSPDKMEIDVPNKERDSQEYQENINEEGEYWHGEGDKYGEKGQEGHDNLNEDREKNKETYNNEKDHQQQNQESFHNVMNETYQSDKDKLESHHDQNQDHYGGYHDSHELQTVPPVPETDKGDRYGDKGQEYMENGADKMENYEPGQNYPTITYTRD